MNTLQEAYDNNEKERIFESASKFSEFVDATIKDSMDQEAILEMLGIASCVAGWAESGPVDWIIGGNVHNARVDEFIEVINVLIGRVRGNPFGATFLAYSVAGTIDDAHTYRALVITCSTGPTEIFLQWLS